MMKVHSPVRVMPRGPLRSQGKLALRLVTLLAWLAVAASIVFWALKFVRPTPVPAQASMAALAPQTPPVDTQAVARALGGGKSNATDSGASQAEPVRASAINASRFVLTGVVAGGSPLALIGVDGKPARPWRVGQALTDGVVLQRVEPGAVVLASSREAGDGVRLELPRQMSALAGTALPSRPPMPVVAQTPPSAPPSAPAGIPQVSVSGPGLNLPPGAVATPGAIGQNPARSPASQMRADREAAREKERARREAGEAQAAQ